MSKYYRAIYCGNGKCFTLVCVMWSDTSDNIFDTIISNLHHNSWAVITLDSDSATPPKEINL